MRDEDEWTDDEVDYQDHRSSTGSSSTANRFPRSRSPSPSPKPYRGRLQEHFSWTPSPNTMDRALRTPQSSRRRHQASGELAVPPPRGHIDPDLAAREGSTIAFNFSLGEDDHSDEEEDPFEPQRRAPPTHKVPRSRRPSPQPPLSVQTRRLGSSSTDSSPLLALLSLPLPSYAPLTPPGHQLQESGPNSPSLALSNAEEEQARQGSGASEHSISSPADVRDQPLSATLRRLGAKRESQKIDCEEEGCIFASEQRRAFSTGRFDSRPAGFGDCGLPQSRRDVKVRTAPRGFASVTAQREDEAGDLANLLAHVRSESLVRPDSSLHPNNPSSSIFNARSQVPGEGNAAPGRSALAPMRPRGASRSLHRPARDASRWTRLADGWGGLLPPRDWFSSRTLGPLRSPVVAVPPSGTHGPPVTHERSDGEENHHDVAHIRTEMAAIKPAKKHKSLLLTKLRKVAEEAPAWPKERPLAAHKKQTSNSNSNGTSTSDWEDVWVSEVEGEPIHQLVQHLMQPLVQPELQAEGSGQSRAQRRVRFASFLPTLKQATRTPLYPLPESASEKRDRSCASDEEDTEDEGEAEREDIYRRSDAAPDGYLPDYSATAALRQETESRLNSATARKPLRPFLRNKGKPESPNTRHKDIELGIYPFASSPRAFQASTHKTAPRKRPTHLLRRRILSALLPAGPLHPVLLSLGVLLLLFLGATIGLSLGLVSSQKSLRTARAALPMLQGQVSTLQTQATALNEEITSLDAQVASLTSEEANLKTQLSSAEAAEANSEAALTKLASQVNSAVEAANVNRATTTAAAAAAVSATSATTGTTNATTQAATMTASAAR